MKIIVTGAAGFIGFHLCNRLLAEGCKVVGIDNLNDYYDPELKEYRLGKFDGFAAFEFHKVDLENKEVIDQIFSHGADMVINLAAQAGVRYSLDNPQAYIDSNVTAFLNVLEACRNNGINRLFYASSSSVYGGNESSPFVETDSVDLPLNMYAATKRMNELMAQSYHSLYGLECVGLRFFTVYGPWGRPDMAFYKFANAISNNESIDLYNGGNHFRSFTYIDDVVESIVRLMQREPETEIYNIGGDVSCPLLEAVASISALLGKNPDVNLLPLQKGDVVSTVANTQKLQDAIGFVPKTPLKVGLTKFVEWFKEYHK